MEENSLQPNLPNAAKLVYSLRHLDYENVTALADLVDNCVDANASKIWIDIFPNRNKEEDSESEIGKIIISDNGKGMTADILDEALKLGSDVPKNDSYDLGLYGMGLITASISMGTRLEVITKSNNSEIYRAVQDLEIIFEQNKFVKIQEKADEHAQVLFKRMVIENQEKILDKSDKNDSIKNSGTVVIIDNIDNCQWKKIKGLEENLILQFGQIYRKFIKANKIKIYINSKLVEARDPIYDYEPSILYEDEIALDEGKIKITVAELKDYGAAINKEKGFNISNQGFYILRNNREILSGDTLGIFSKHNDFNLLRIEFSFTGTLDQILSSNFSKNRIVLGQSLKNKVEKICNPFIKQVRNNAKKRQHKQQETKEDFTEVEKYITQKSHLLKTPQVEIENRNKPINKNTDTVHKTIEKHGPRLDIKKRKRIDLNSLKVKFGSVTMGDKGPLYSTDQEKDKIVINWNKDHPFYTEFIERNTSDPDIFNPICFLIYCFADAELIAGVDTDTLEVIENIRYDVGRNLAVLLK